ncbi:MAG: NifU family protein [Treponemataceae bacterium]|nr:NifU family protein [Treponemataceae bacterium]
MLDVEKVKRAIESIRPQLQADGGDIEFIRAEDDGKVYVKLHGACGSCPMALMTLKEGVEVFLKENIPEVTSVEQEF